MFGTRSPQLIAEAGQALPNVLVHLMVPSAGSSPYTLSFSVAAISVPLTTIGWPYTWPSTTVENSCPKLDPLTEVGVSAGWSLAQPVRAASVEIVEMSPDAGEGATAPPTTSSTTASAARLHRFDTPAP